MNKIVWVYMRRGLKNLKVISRKTIHASQHCDQGYYLVTVLDFIYPTARTILYFINSSNIISNYYLILGFLVKFLSGYAIPGPDADVGGIA